MSKHLVAPYVKIVPFDMEQLDMFLACGIKNFAITLKYFDGNYTEVCSYMKEIYRKGGSILYLESQEENIANSVSVCSSHYLFGNRPLLKIYDRRYLSLYSDDEIILPFDTYSAIRSNKFLDGNLWFTSDEPQAVKDLYIEVSSRVRDKYIPYSLYHTIIQKDIKQTYVCVYDQEEMIASARDICLGIKYGLNNINHLSRMLEGKDE